jgi:hypothetical protein
VPDEVAAWAERELLAQLHEESPWLAAYPTISWFFLPVLLSKDGRETSRQFLREYAAGFPDADWEDGLQFYESFLDRGILEEYRYVMASKLGTTESFDLDRMRSAMSEFTVARLLDDAGYDVEPDVEVTTGHFIDFRVDRGGPAFLVEVTRPRPPDRRSAGTVGKAITETVDTKTTGQLAAHGGGITLFVDCSSFSADQWATVRRDHPSVAHRPAVVFRAHTDGHFEGYTLGSVPIDLPETFERV